MRRVVVIVVLFVLSLFGGDKGFEVSKDVHDLTCGLKPYKYPKWVTQLELKNGKKLHFVSVKCMMLFYFKNAKWHDLNATSKEDIVALRVQDFNSLHVLNAKDAYYVFGSNVRSPKGDDLVPFETKNMAKTFMKMHHGSKVLGFKDFKVNLFDYLNL